MIGEDRELLLKDLCARLPYRVKVDVNFYNATKELSCDLLKDFIIDEKSIRPYLRPMSSMTKEEKTELQEVVKSNPIRPFGELTNKCDNLTRSVAYGAVDIVSYLLSKHFDIYNLIERDLALEALEGMYNLKEK